MKNTVIAYCIPALYYPSGMERVLTMKANFLVSRGYEVHIILTDGGDKPPYFPLDPSIKLHQLNIDFEEPYHHSFLRRVLMYQKRMKVFRKELDTCLCQIKPDITISLLRRDINIINKMTDGSIKMGEIHFDRLHYRNFNAPWMPTVLYTFIQRRWMNSLITEIKKLAKFVVLTYEDTTFWPELDNMAVIHNPTSFSGTSCSTCTNKQVVAIGRYVSQKGFDRLISAWQAVASQHPDWILRIYGDGKLREQLQVQIDRLHLQNSCILEHTTSCVENVFCESAIYVLSSRYEGLPLVIIEAMSCGLPVVSFACHCGPRDIISDGKNGLLVEEGDIEGLSKAINKLIDDKNLRQKMGEQAHTDSLNYKIDRIGQQWIDLFEQILREGSKN